MPPLFARPKLKSFFQAHVVADRVLVLREDRQEVVIEHPDLARVAALADGERTLSDILSVLAASVPAPRVFFALQQLERRGFTVEGEGQPDRAGADFLERFDARTPAVVDGLARFRVRVEGVGRVPDAPLAEVLRENGLQVAEAEDFDLQVVLAEDYLLPELDAINAARLVDGRPWMLVKPVGLELWVGPIFVPSSTACWRCMAQRLEMNRQVEAYVRNRSGLDRPLGVSRASLPATLELAASLAATEAVRFAIAPEKALGVGRLTSMDTTTRATKVHVLVRRPQCSACGAAPAERPEPRPVMTSRRKKFREDGGHRIATPEETLARFQHHVSPILGVVTELRPSYTARIPLVPSYIAGHNFSMGIHSLIFLREVLRGSSGGKGASDIQAKVSGLCEAIERYSGNRFGDEPARRATYEELGPLAIHPNAVMGFSERQIERRMVPHPVAPSSRCVLVPRPFDPKLTIDWTPLWSLAKEEVRYLPSAFCWYGHPDFERTMSMFPESNGTASGNAIEEAFLQGFFELIERDAVGLWWYNKVRRRGVDLDSFRMPYVDAIREFYPTIGRDLWVVDITSDFPISTFACMSRRTDREAEDIILGFGSHFDPRIALLRAITEVNQFLPSLLPQNADGSTRYVFGDQLAEHWWKTAKLAENEHLSPRADQPPVRLQDLVDLSKDDLLEDVRTCVQLCKDRNMDVLLLEQTRPDIGLDVVKVVVPELCHFWRRLGKPRLFDVPHANGWVKERLTEETCNQYTVFF